MCNQYYIHPQVSFYSLYLTHTINAKALVISRIRQDMKLCIGFGCGTRVKQPNEYN